ncbi:MAG TPA: hypothetical protein QGF02_01260 [Candidatus Babeliales bacterium]|nr:hypothetical protein [Candidatus Babeliales bacterium]
MNKINKLKLSLVIISLLSGTVVQAQFPINIVRPYDIDLHWQPEPAGTWQYGVLAEVAPSVNAYNAHGKKTDVLQLWNNTVDGLAMLRGFPADSEIGQLNATLAGVSNNGVRGNLVPTGNLSIWDASFSVRYFFPCYLSLGLYLPLFHMSLNDINFCDLTQNVTADDLLVKELLTNNFVNNVRDLSGSFGCENKNVLDIGNSWNKTGVGDLTILGVWSRDFPQVKPVLKNVRLTGRLGVTVPTGMRTNENLLFPIPYGNDGALGVVFGGNIELQWWSWLRGGVQADFWRVFGDTRDRRVKTDASQTDLVLLARIPTHKTWGFTRRYTLYAELGDFKRGYSLALGYQYFNKGTDSLTVVSNQYITAAAETAQSIEEWKLHNFIVDLSVRCGEKDTLGRTRASFFYKHPFNGTRAVAAKTLGMRLIVDF